MELCLSTNYFIFDNRVCILENSGLIGLALMVVSGTNKKQHFFPRKNYKMALLISATPMFIAYLHCF